LLVERGLPDGRSLVELTRVPSRNSRVGMTAGSIHVSEVYRFEPPHLWVTHAP
jgi:hypothetical protein